MDSLFSKFSLQTFLRQFFCGVVFFVPLYIFGGEQITQIGHIVNWKSGTFFLFAAVSSAVGTIIYHLEKNLYSYPLMYLYEKTIYQRDISQESDSEAPQKQQYYWITWCFLGIIFLLSLGCTNLLPHHPWLMLLIASFIYLFLVAHCLLNISDEHIVRPTLKMWKIEHLAKVNAKRNNDTNEDSILLKQCAAADKLANWADFIHCTQSCCFAWIFGSLLVYNITGVIHKGWYQGIAIAILILAAEVIIDMHRYRFLTHIRNNYRIIIIKHKLTDKHGSDKPHL